MQVSFHQRKDDPLFLKCLLLFSWSYKHIIYLNFQLLMNTLTATTLQTCLILGFLKWEVGQSERTFICISRQHKFIEIQVIAQSFISPTQIKKVALRQIKMTVQFTASLNLQNKAHSQKKQHQSCI